MKNSERPSGSFDEDGLERLLEDFFQREMPAELREAGPSLAVLDRSSMTAPTGRGLGLSNDLVRLTAAADAVRQPTAGRIGLTVSAAALCVMFAALWSSSLHTQGPAETHPLARNAPAAPVAPVAESPIAEPLPLTAFEAIDGRTEPLERLTYDTASGPVEQRTNMRWSNVSVYEPQSGAQVEVLIPELSIEIFEIEK